MFKLLKKEIKALARSKINKRVSRDAKFQDYRDRIEKRSGAVVSSLKPWRNVRDNFDPVHCARNANAIAKSMMRRIESGKYFPEAAKKFDIPKKDGSLRELSMFSIPDSAIARVIYRSIVRRNIRVFSSSSYAYLPDRDVFDAIKSLSDIPKGEKIYSIQVDFKKFFDRIPYEFLEKLIANDGSSPVRVTAVERKIIHAFLKHDYTKKIIKRSTGLEAEVTGKREVGTPQGSSISLVLANLALHGLDKDLEILAGKFVRYADDVVAITTTYEQAVQVERAFYRYSGKYGLEINKNKSPGIAAFDDAPQEIRTVGEIDFLGYRFTRAGMTINSNVEARIKAKLSRLIHLYLIHYIRKGSIGWYRFSRRPHPFDWDLLGLISELRRTIYGGNSEDEISQCLYRGGRISKMHGIMAHYALIEDLDAFKRLDGWLVNEIRRAMVARDAILRKVYSSASPVGLLPNNRKLIDGSWLDMDAWVKAPDDNGKTLPEVRMPSFVKACKAAKIHMNNFGLGRKENNINNSNEDLSDLLEY